MGLGCWERGNREIQEGVNSWTLSKPARVELDLLIELGRDLWVL